MRSPGSTIKPLAVYAPALNKGYHYDSELPDELKAYGTNKYTPHNWNNVYGGDLPMYKALAESKNTSAVWLLNKIGVKTGFDSVEKFGITLDPSDENLSLALGGLKKGSRLIRSQVHIRLLLMMVYAMIPILSRRSLMLRARRSLIILKLIQRESFQLRMPMR